MIKPRFKCLKCKHLFPRKKCGPTNCPKCGHLWVKWINYKLLFGKKS